ncbi:hypothetical protein ACRZ5S_22885 (plasmid) [Vibrio scophthalmi]|uniref:hypothetical protein n=1 Tax=Vibrio scophthalmi TaxID=45658 RepID=UPI003EBF2BA9
MLITIDQYINDLGISSEDHDMWSQLFLKDIITGELEGQLVDGVWMVKVLTPMSQAELNEHLDFEQMTHVNPIDASPNIDICETSIIIGEEF